MKLTKNEIFPAIIACLKEDLAQEYSVEECSIQEALGNNFCTILYFNNTNCLIYQQGTQIVASHTLLADKAHFDIAEPTLIKMITNQLKHWDCKMKARTEAAQHVNDQIVMAIAAEISFECQKLTNNKYRWFLRHDSNDPRLKECPPLPMDNFTQNPCHEIPLDYEVYININDTKIEIQNHIVLDLNDPTLVDQVKKLFSDLNILHATYEKNRITKAYRDHLGLVRKS